MASSQELTTQNNNSEEESGNEMTFLEHLEELRWRIIYSLIGLVVGTAIAWIFIDFLINNILLKPAAKAGVQLQNLRPFGQLYLYFEVAIAAGIILSLPNLFYQFWKFVAPALKKSERKYISLTVAFSTLCFLVGIVFAYFVLLPFVLKFAVQFGTKAIKNEFAINEYMTIIISAMLGAGLVFELPLISFFLTKLGVITPALMSKYRRYAIVVIFIVSAFLTPPDVATQLIMAGPLLVLYEVSILISRLSVKKKK